MVIPDDGRLSTLNGLSTFREAALRLR